MKKLSTLLATCLMGSIALSQNFNNVAFAKPSLLISPTDLNLRVQDDKPDAASEKKAYDAYNAARAEKDFAKQQTMIKEALGVYPKSQYVKFFKELLGANIGNRFQTEIKAEKIDTAFKIYSEEVVTTVPDLEVNYLLAFLDPLSRSAKKPDTPNADIGQTVLKKAIDVIKSGKAPVNVPEWDKKKPAVLASLYQTVGLYTWKASKKDDDALNVFKESISQDCSDPVTYYFVAELYKGKYDALSKEYEALAEADKTGDRGKELLDKINGVVDSMIEYYAKTLGVSESKAKTYEKLRAGVQGAVELFWKFRHEEKLDGLTEFLGKFKTECPTANASPGGTN
ncbi:MAG: hypothetical protein HY819_03095 [Acidobacteria bacterium]|nr:hypothetical protein [Acidobacteriota bacterium]